MSPYSASRCGTVSPALWHGRVVARSPDRATTALKAAKMTQDEIIKGIEAPGKFDATAGSEAEALRAVRTALPHATELPPAVAGQPYPLPPKGVKAWFQVQPAEPGVGNNLLHVKYADWTGG